MSLLQKDFPVVPSNALPGTKPTTQIGLNTKRTKPVCIFLKIRLLTFLFQAPFVSICHVLFFQFKCFFYHVGTISECFPCSKSGGPLHTSLAASYARDVKGAEPPGRKLMYNRIPENKADRTEQQGAVRSAVACVICGDVTGLQSCAKDLKVKFAKSLARLFAPSSFLFLVVRPGAPSSSLYSLLTKSNLTNVFPNLGLQSS